jgi:CheY-like chemotaxis protein
VILVIDDDEAVRETTAALLSHLGYAADTAADADAALAAIERELPAIILLDVYMPGMDGFEFLRALRESAIHTPVVITSGAIPGGESDPMLSAALALGADGVIRKPFRVDELQTLIARVAPAVGRAAAGSNA